MYSSGMLKPDCVKRGLVEEVLSYLEEKGLEIVIKKEVSLNKEDVDVLYGELYSTAEFYPGLCESMMSGKAVFYVVRSENAIDLLNDLVGSTEPTKAADYTVRRKYGTNIRENVIHSTENERTFRLETNHFLSREEKKLLRKKDVSFQQN